MSARRLLSELDRLEVKLRVVGAQLSYSGPEESVTQELLDRIKAHKAELLRLLTWKEDEAYRLIKDALTYLCKRHVEAGKPDFDPVAVNEAYDRVDEACGAEDMAALHHAVRSFVAVGLKEFRRERGAA